MEEQAKLTNTLPTQLAQDLLYAIKTQKPYESYLIALQQLTVDNLVELLDSEAKRLSFWINIYNAFIQLEFYKTPDHKPSNFFTKKCLPIAGQVMSFDLIEHGILRRSKFKYSLGYFNKLFVDKTEKRLRVDKVDYRIHFALNCGAKSCPPIAFYSDEKIEEELDLATAAYLENESIYHARKNMVEIAKLMQWFRGDFGGKSGIIRMLQQYNIIPTDTHPRLVFRPYDWTVVLDNFRD
ncbi:DUF547 domain-containing protein [Microscilla marina]|uniref:PutAtive secreted protein n=1 Tax=Microscilla marina ATCC 23134 TaxID=313606 RepID=A1ZZ73_MICM2|nr:DUF547 domain-containing protein [Microscilla marina]EAY24332.1 putAtive secreted protein [Microscilla marina ATCC 23134]